MNISTLTIPTQYCPIGSSQSNEGRKRSKDSWIVKEEVKLSLVTIDVIVYVQILMESTKIITRTNI